MAKYKKIRNCALKWPTLPELKWIDQIHTTPTMRLSHIPQCTIQNRNVHIFVLNGALWDMGQEHCGICETGLFWYLITSSFQWEMFPMLHSPCQFPCTWLLIKWCLFLSKCKISHFRNTLHSVLSISLGSFSFKRFIIDTPELVPMYSISCQRPCYLRRVIALAHLHIYLGK